MTVRIRVDKLRHHPDNPPERHADVAELADSIRAVGLLQPLLVEPAAGAYVVVAGNRRLAAARLLGLVEVECTVRRAHDRQSHTEVRLIENGHRRNLSPLEQARGFGQLRADGLSHAQIARRTGFSESHVSERLALLELDATSQDSVERGVISVREAVEAIRSTRRPALRARPRAERTPLATNHFGHAHQLAPEARALCRRAHGDLHAFAGLGGVACGRCWETAIRADERQAVGDTTVHDSEEGVSS